MNTLYIFDLDNTLIDTEAKIKIRNRYGKVVAELGTVEHNNRRSFDDLLSKNLTLDYEEFESYNQLKKEKKLPFFKEFEYHLKSNQPYIVDDIYISTARQDPYIIREWVSEETGIELEQSHIHSCNFEQYETTAEDKAEFLNNLLYHGNYDRVVIYEDDQNNIKSYKELMKNVWNNIPYLIIDTSNVE